MRMNRLPSVLTFDTKQNSISVERALKNILLQLEAYEPDEPNTAFVAALDDLQLMINAVEHGEPVFIDGTTYSNQG